MSETTVPVDVADQQLELSNPHTLGNRAINADHISPLAAAAAAAAAMTPESGSNDVSSPVSASSSPDNVTDSSNLITIIDQEAAVTSAAALAEDDEDDEEAFLSAVERVLHSVDRQLRSNAAFLKLPLSYITPHIMQHLLQQRLLLTTTTTTTADGFQVQYLDLTGNMLGDAGAAVIAEHLLRSDRYTVQYLNLSMNQIGSDGCRALCEALMTRRDVEHDHGSSISDSGNSGVSSSVVSVTSPSSSAIGSSGNTSLQHLDISVNQIGFGGVAALCDMLRANSTLVSLNVRSNRMRGDKCVTKLLELSAIAQNKINFKDLFV